MTEKVCVECYRSFIPNSKKQIFCSKECQIKCEIRKNAEKKAERIHASIRQPKVSISEMQKRADASGMSYGQYVAKKGEN